MSNAIPEPTSGAVPTADAVPTRPTAGATPVPETQPTAAPDPMLTAHLDAALLEALEAFARHEHVVIGLDFDGTLAPLVDDPRDSRMLDGSADAVAEFAAMEDVTLAIVSGRQAMDLAEVAFLPEGTLVIGSHGAQLGRVRFTGERAELVAEPIDLTDRQQELLAEVTRRVEAIAAGAPASRVEHKPAATVLHTRGIDPEDADRATQEALDGPGAIEGVRAIHGKDVVEIGVLDVTKGDGIELLRERSGAAACLYIGDDTTDEDAFTVLRGEDLGIKVGTGDTAAQFRVDSPAEVSLVLLHLVELLRARRGV